MAGAFGAARSNDLIPNGPIVPLADITLPGTLNLATYQTYGQAAVLNCIASGTWSVGTLALPTAGVSHAASQEVYLPVNGAPTLFINGSGTFSATLYTSRANES